MLSLKSSEINLVFLLWVSRKFYLIFLQVDFMTDINHIDTSSFSELQRLSVPQGWLILYKVPRQNIKSKTVS